jgi:hypothetical protein
MGLNFSFWQSLVQATLGSLCISLSWPKDPLRMKMKEEIGRVGGGVRGRPTTMTLHFPFLNLLSYFILFYFISFNYLFFLSFPLVLFNFYIALIYIVC